MEFELIRYVFFLLALTSTAALAQNIQLSPSQQQMLNQLPPAQRQMALEALKNQSGRTPIRTVHESNVSTPTRIASLFLSGTRVHGHLDWPCASSRAVSMASGDATDGIFLGLRLNSNPGRTKS